MAYTALLYRCGHEPDWAGDAAAWRCEGYAYALPSQNPPTCPKVNTLVTIVGNEPVSTLKACGQAMELQGEYDLYAETEVTR